MWVAHERSSPDERAIPDIGGIVQHLTQVHHTTQLHDDLLREKILGESSHEADARHINERPTARSGRRTASGRQMCGINWRVQSKWSMEDDIYD